MTRVRQAGLEADSDQWLLPNPSGQMPFFERAACGQKMNLDFSMSNGKFALMDLDDQRRPFGDIFEQLNGCTVGGFGLCSRTSAIGGFQRKPAFARVLRNDRLWVEKRHLPSAV